MNRPFSFMVRHRFLDFPVTDSYTCPCLVVGYRELSHVLPTLKSVIGVSLSEPHTSNMNGTSIMFTKFTVKAESL